MSRRGRKRRLRQRGGSLSPAPCKSCSQGPLSIRNPSILQPLWPQAPQLKSDCGNVKQPYCTEDTALEANEARRRPLLQELLMIAIRVSHIAMDTDVGTLAFHYRTILVDMTLHELRIFYTYSFTIKRFSCSNSRTINSRPTPHSTLLPRHHQSFGRHCTSGTEYFVSRRVLYHHHHIRQAHEILRGRPP